jgi:hypothetical protein
VLLFVTLICSSDEIGKLKMLIPDAKVGAIMGENGVIIDSMRHLTGIVDILMAKRNTFFPNTTYRVCLLTGKIGALQAAVEFILARITDDELVTDETNVVVGFNCI